MDGEIIIDTKIDDSKLGKQIKNLQEKIEKEEVDLNIKLGETEEAKEEVNYLSYVTKKIREEQQEQVKVLEGKKRQYQAINEAIKSGQAISNEEYQRYGILGNDIAKLEAEQQKLNATYGNFNNKLNKATDNLGKAERKYEAQEKKIKSLKENLGELIQKYNEQNAFNISNITDRMGKGITKIIRNISKWTLAIFGIRSAYMAVRSAMSTISQQDDQLKADIDYMRNAVAFALEPIVRKIVDWMKSLLYYVAYIIKLVTGKNIFENANKSLQGANKNAKDLKKTLAGFDEMNVLSDTSGGASGGVSPSIDLTKIGDADLGGVTKLIQKIEKMFSDLYTWLVTSFVNIFQKMGFSDNVIYFFVMAVNGIKDVIKGLYEFIKGILQIIIGLFSGNTDMIKEGFVNLAKGIKDIIKGIINFVVGIFMGFGATIGNIWNNIKKTVNDICKSMMEGLKEKIGTGINKINEFFGKIPTFMKSVVDKVLGFFKNFGTKVGDVIGSAFKAVINGVLSAIENILNFPIKSINALIGTINKIPGINLGKLPTFKLPRLAKGGIVNNPGPGVMMGSYVAGEKGPEAVIPLDDATLDRLGLAFARHTTINATIPVYVANRQIAKEIRRINAEDDFAFNR